jgi:hypothetical protein
MTAMPTPSRLLAAVLCGTALMAVMPAAAQGPAQPRTTVAAPSPVRADLTRPGGLPGAARSIGAPERFCDPAVDKKKCKGTTSD